MRALTPVFAETEMLYCSVPVPPINNHKGASFDFTAEQIANYGQSQTHPSILYFPNGWNGHKYWLATTPYPHAEGVFENPCIYYGDEENGNPPRVFTPISGTASGAYTVVNNPVVKVPNNTTTNSDPDIWHDETANTIILISRENTFYYATFAQKTANGQAWTPRGNNPLWKCGEDGLAGKPEFLSPAIVKVGNKIRIYSLSGTAGIYGLDFKLNRGLCWGLYVMEGTTFENGGDFAFLSKSAILGKRGIEAWHMDLFTDAQTGYLYMIFCARNRFTNTMDVYLAESTDGLNFTLFAKPLLATNSHYRPTAVIRDSDRLLVVYWSITNASTSPSRYPNGASDVPVDGRTIGLSYKNFDDVLAELRNDKVLGYD